MGWGILPMHCFHLILLFHQGFCINFCNQTMFSPSCLISPFPKARVGPTRQASLKLHACDHNCATPYLAFAHLQLHLPEVHVLLPFTSSTAHHTSSALTICSFFFFLSSLSSVLLNSSSSNLLAL